MCRLPSGRLLFYYKPHFKLVTQFGKKVQGLFYWGVKAVEGRPSTYAEIQTYGGKLAENVTQAACNCLLREALLRVEAAGYPIFLHVHDEGLSQRRIREGSLDEYCAIFAETPAWAAGFPVGASGWRGRRYKKD
jgi:DNA polymerase